MSVCRLPPMSARVHIAPCGVDACGDRLAARFPSQYPGAAAQGCCARQAVADRVGRLRLCGTGPGRLQGPAPTGRGGNALPGVCTLCKSLHGRVRLAGVVRVRRRDRTQRLRLALRLL